MEFVDSKESRATTILGNNACAISLVYLDSTHVVWVNFPRLFLSANHCQVENNFLNNNNYNTLWVIYCDNNNKFILCVVITLDEKYWSLLYDCKEFLALQDTGYNMGSTSWCRGGGGLLR